MKKKARFLRSALVASGLLVLFSTPMRAVAGENESGSELATLNALLENAESNEERAYYGFLIEKRHAAQEDDRKGLALISRKMAQFGLSRKDNPLGVMAIAQAGDILADYVGNDAEALEYYAIAQNILEKNPKWDICGRYAPYLGIRMGDALWRERQYEKATDRWKQTFLQHPNRVFSLQIPAKVRSGHSKYLAPEKAFLENRKFFDEAAQSISAEPGKGRVLTERFDLLNDATQNLFFEKDELAREAQNLLETYGLGENGFVDDVRGRLESIVAESDKRRADRLRADVDVGDIRIRKVDVASSAPVLESTDRIASPPPLAAGPDKPAMREKRVPNSRRHSPMKFVGVAGMACLVLAAIVFLKQGR